MSMTKRPHDKAFQFWMLFAILTYSIQSMGSVGMGMSHKTADSETASKMYSSSMNECHGHKSAEVSPLDEISRPDSQHHSLLNCCDADCSMSNCHSMHATLNVIVDSNFLTSIDLHRHFYISHPSNPINSLYRPPILV